MNNVSGTSLQRSKERKVSLDRKTAARKLREIAQLLELHGENPHRIRAFANASRSVEKVEGDLEALVASGEILGVRGIGKGTAAVLADLGQGVEPSVLTDLDGKTPPGVKELLQISGLGPKKVRALWSELEISSPGELEYACGENRLVELSGFGAASQKKVLDAVRFYLANRESHLIHRAWGVATDLMTLLSAVDGLGKVIPTGELRRGTETVSVIEMVAVGREDVVGDAARAVLEGPQRTSDGVWSGTFRENFLVRITTAKPENVGWALLRTTGSEAHFHALGQRAARVGMEFDGEGLWSGGQLIPCPDEETLYDVLGCQWVPPELRDGGREVAMATRGELPDLVVLSDLRGALHNHTNDSDGSASVEDMARAAGALGWEFIGIGDHSPAAHYANGLSAARLRRQGVLIETLNKRGDLPRLVKGLEADILPDGTLDVPDTCRAELQYVVASVHSSFGMSKETQTERVISAIRDPSCRVLGHPTGRLLLARPGYDIDLDRVLEACADSGVAAEINASPYRLDLDHVWARKAIAMGVGLMINPDAHSTEGLKDVRWGVMVARRAGASASSILNCGDVEAWIRAR